MERYVSGKVSEHERVKIDAWLDAMGADDNTDLELSKEEEDRIFQELTSSLTSVEDMIKLKPKRKLRLDQWVIRIAATLAIIAMSYVVWQYTIPSENQLEVVSNNGVDKIILNDGSLVWLRDKESKVAYYEKKSEGVRYAKFEGEALFEIAKDENHPFIIECGDAKVRVLGTSFSLKTNADQVELTVLTGKVNFSSSINTEGMEVLPLEKAIYKSNGTMEKLTANQQDINAVTINTDYNMQFSNTLMNEVVAYLERKFNVSIKLSDKNIRNCMITMDFTDQSLEKSLQLITDVLEVTYAVQGKTVTITGTGCK
ncbi:MAG: FecR family protein [Cyclobacteriaceae bacterium]|nr:FecR family protein [Cyclobacteriaceae bacterium]